MCRVGQARLKSTPSSREFLGRSADDRFARVRQDTDTETDKRTDKRETATDNQVTTRLVRSGRFRAFERGKKNGVDGRKEPVPTTITLPLPQRQTANSVERARQELGVITTLASSQPALSCIGDLQKDPVRHLRTYYCSVIFVHLHSFPLWPPSSLVLLLLQHLPHAVHSHLQCWAARAR